MEEWISTLIQKSHLEIIDYGYHVRLEMNIQNRVFPYCMMSYLKKGEAILRVGGEEYYCGSGSVIFVPPNLLHDHIKISEGEAHFLWWHFNFKTDYGMSILNILKFPYCVYIEEREDFEQKFEKYMEAIRNKRTIADEIRKEAKALEVLAIIFDSFLNSKKIQVVSDVPEAFLDIFNEILEKPRADMTLASLGEKYYMHPTYISNKFKHYFGITPIVLMRNILFGQAKDLLLSTTMSIQDIAKQLGFSDIAVFSRFFTLKAGVSPKTYRIRKVD